jgi:monoterpene epsilon-lactone hydrolase|eukprot:COSAG01_NODE_2095_length_8411_cov_3.964611_5_plen_734_part_00
MEQEQELGLGTDLGPEPETEPQPEPEPEPQPGERCAALLGSLRYGESLVILSRKYMELNVLSSDGVVGAIAWAGGGSSGGGGGGGGGGAWVGARLALLAYHHAVAGAVRDDSDAGGDERPPEFGAGGRLVCYGDTVELSVAGVGPPVGTLSVCGTTGLLVARRPATAGTAGTAITGGGWHDAVFRVERADGARGTAASLCSFCDIRLLHVATGHYLRACTADASTVGSATAQLGGVLAHSAVAGHAEPAAAVTLSQFSGLKMATKCSGGPRVHVLRCASQRDHEREVMALIASSQESCQAAWDSCVRYRNSGASLAEDTWASSASKVVMIGAGVIGSSAKVLMGMRGTLRQPSWNKKFVAGIQALQVAARNCPLNVTHMRNLTDHTIPEFMLSGNSSVERADLPGNICAEWHLPSGESIGSCRIKVLYLHGGAFCTCNSRTHRDLLHRLSLASHAAFLAIDYRRPPEYPCPVPIDDSIMAYRWLTTELRVRPEDVFIAGDSAGGALAVSTLVALRNLGDPLPAGGMLFSPWVDVSDGRGDGGACPQRPSFTEHAASDYITPHLAQFLASCWAGGRDLQDPLVSPLFADLEGLPPLLVQCGGSEVLRDQVVAFAERAKAASVNVTLQVAAEMPHVFQLFAFTNQTGIAKYIDEAGVFIREHATVDVDAVAVISASAHARNKWLMTQTALSVQDSLGERCLRAGWLHKEASSRFGLNSRWVMLLGDPAWSEQLLM